MRSPLPASAGRRLLHPFSTPSPPTAMPPGSHSLPIGCSARGKVRGASHGRVVRCFLFCAPSLMAAVSALAGEGASLINLHFQGDHP